MWNNTRDFIQNSLNNFGQIFTSRRNGSNSSIDLDFRRRTIRRPRRTNRNNCLSRSSTRASTINSQLNRELLNSSTNSQNSIRPPHAHNRTCHSSLSSNLSSPSSQHTCFTPLPSDSINNSSSLTSSTSSNHFSNRSLSPILPLVTNSRYPISCSPYPNVFSQQYLRSLSRSICNLTGDLHPLQLTKEKNYLSIIINLLVIVTIVIAIIQPRWFSISGNTGSLCNNKYIGLQEIMFVQNPSIRNPFSSFNNNPLMNDPKIYTLPPPNYNDGQNRQKKINYFKLIPDNFVENHNLEHLNQKNSNQEHINQDQLIKEQPNDHNQLTKANLTNLNRDQLNNQNLTLTNNTVNHQSSDKLLDKSSRMIEPIHLPLSQSNEQNKNHLMFKSNEKVKKSISNTDSQIQFYRNLADHFQKQTTTNDACLSPEVLSLQRLIIILCVFVIFSTLIQLLLDFVGTNNKYMSLLREHAIFNIISIIICIMIVGISYLLSNLLTKEQTQKHHLLNNPNRFYNYPNFLDKNKVHSPINYFNLDKDENRIEVKLELSYYLVIFAGIFSLVGSFLECNIFVNKPNLYLININRDQETSNLLNDESQAGWSHLFNVNNPNNFRNLVNSFYFQPPPPYTPSADPS